MFILCGILFDLLIDGPLISFGFTAVGIILIVWHLVEGKRNFRVIYVCFLFCYPVCMLAGWGANVYINHLSESLMTKLVTFKVGIETQKAYVDFCKHGKSDGKNVCGFLNYQIMLGATELGLPRTLIVMNAFNKRLLIDVDSGRLLNVQHND